MGGQVFHSASLDVVFDGSKRILASDRSSCLDMFCKKGVLENFAKFTKKHLCRTFFFNKVAAWKPVTLSKMRPRYMCFTMNFVNFYKKF